LKEANSGVVGELHSHAPGLALLNERNLQTSYHPHDLNWCLLQFKPAAESLNSIQGETFNRVANPEHFVRLAICLKVALLYPPTTFTRRNQLSYSANKHKWLDDGSSVPVGHVSESVSGDLRFKWQNN
jgi:hypothetical protein